MNYLILILQASSHAGFKKGVEKSKMAHYSRICLPDGEKFQDNGHAMVAGYGRYRRAPCEVGRHGPEKFEYCGTGDRCIRGSQVS